MRIFLPQTKLQLNNMYQLIAGFPQHLVQALEICNQTKLNPATGIIQNVVITGLGGSGIGGTIVADWAQGQCKVPVIINKDYHIPGFVGKNTLVLACSYSGNTEETLMAMAESLEAGAQVAVITSGGIMQQRAQSLGLNCIVVPGGNPPRSMLGFSLVCLLQYFAHYQLVTGFNALEIATIAKKLEILQPELQMQTKVLAQKIANKTVAVYAASGMGGVATRLRQQLNENAKVVGWDAVVPEMNHNELVGWAGGNQSHAAIFLRSNHDYSRNQFRIDVSRAIIGKNTDAVYEVWADQGTVLNEMLYLIHWGDWLSYYLHEIHGVDIMDIKVIDYLKSELGKI